MPLPYKPWQTPGQAGRGSHPITFQIITQARGLQNMSEPPGLLMQKKRFGCEISAKKCRAADKVKTTPKRGGLTSGL